jgi:hypothetical protein
MAKSYFFLGFVRTHPEDEKRTTSGRDYRVHGGSKEEHERTVELVNGISKEFRRDPPQTPGEARMILMEATKKFGGGCHGQNP